MEHFPHEGGLDKKLLKYSATAGMCYKLPDLASEKGCDHDEKMLCDTQAQLATVKACDHDKDMS